MDYRNAACRGGPRTAAPEKPFTRENLEQAYVQRRRNSWVDAESKIAADSRNGFEYGVVTGLLGMALAGFTRGALHIPARKKPATAKPSAIEALCATHCAE